MLYSAVIGSEKYTLDFMNPRKIIINSKIHRFQEGEF